MIAEFGQFALALALALSLVLAILPLTASFLAPGPTTRALAATARPLAAVLFALVLLAFLCLGTLFVDNDFSVQLVATHSNLSLPIAYRVAATWGSHEGSMLLWVLMLTGWTAAVAAFSGSLPESLRIRILSVMGAIATGFLLFLLFTSNPFARLAPPPTDGRDLNPLLQDPGMVFHPPLLYMGYVGLSVAFAFAVAGLIGGRFDAAWARWTRPWTTTAWAFLTLGIALGSFWAYYELGWGGWWFWDPVENASFMPWLVATALIHSLAVAEKRGAFRSWTVLLAILGFSLSLLGTFLVRSGVLTSVHAFATDPARGVFILIFLALVIGGSLLLYAWRAASLGAGSGFTLVSRESMLLANNVLLLVAMGAVLLGTLYPLALDTLGLGKISVGPPYFETVFYPLMAPALFLMAIGPLSRWKQTPIPDLAHRLRWAFAVAIAGALLQPLTTDTGFRPVAASGLAIGFWIAGAVAIAVLEMLRDTRGRLRPSRARLHPASVWGMQLAHLGIAVFVIGVTLVTSSETGRELKLAPGQSVEVGDWRLDFRDLRTVQGPNYDAMRGRFELRRVTDAADAPARALLSPEKRVYRAQRMPMTEAAIDRSLWRDVYVSMGEPLTGDDWAIRVHVKPFVNWIWFGCVLMALGGFVTITDRRYRRRLSAAEPLPSSATAAAAQPTIGGPARPLPEPSR